MRLPNAARAVVPPAMLAHYLLALAHPVGGSKARFFRAHGFGDHNTDRLAEGLRRIALGAIVSTRQSRHGVKYVVVGDLRTPQGTVATLETVWIVDPHDDRPRLVTAYPAPRD